MIKQRWSMFLGIWVLLLFGGMIFSYFSFSLPQVESKSNEVKSSESSSSLTFSQKVDLVIDQILPSLTGGYQPELWDQYYYPEIVSLSGEVGEFAVFYSHKDISMLDPCTKSNYLLAFNKLDGKLVSAGESFNLNTYLANLRGYCTGRGAKHFVFYGGVCGVASQLFRAGLTNPQVKVDKRHGHNERYAKYYGSIVEGDDAAVYEWSKQFAFTNTSSFPLMIKTLQQGDQTYLFLIAEAKAVDKQRVHIQKTKKSDLYVQVERQVYSKHMQPQIHCKSQISPLFSPQKQDCTMTKDSEQVLSQTFQSRYTKVLDRSL